MAKIERKPLANTLKKDMDNKLSKKEELANKVIERLEGGEVAKVEKKAPAKKETEIQSKMTVMIPESYHNKLKQVALNKKKKIREIIIELIESL